MRMKKLFRYIVLATIAVLLPGLGFGILEIPLIAFVVITKIKNKR